MSDNGVKPEDDDVQSRDEGGDHEVRDGLSDTAYTIAHAQRLGND